MLPGYASRALGVGSSRRPLPRAEHGSHSTPTSCGRICDRRADPGPMPHHPPLDRGPIPDRVRFCLCAMERIAAV